MMYFSSNLLYLRKKKGLRQEEVGEVIKLGQRAIAKYELGKSEPTLENLLNISRFFEVTVDDLISKDLKPTGAILSRNLRFLRKKLGYQQIEMCKLLKVSQPALANYENGVRTLSIEELVDISEFFGVSIDDLIKKDLSKKDE